MKQHKYHAHTHNEGMVTEGMETEGMEHKIMVTEGMVLAAAKAAEGTADLGSQLVGSVDATPLPPLRVSLSETERNIRRRTVAQTEDILD